MNPRAGPPPRHGRGHVVAEVLTDALATIDRAAPSSHDLTTARAHQAGDDTLARPAPAGRRLRATSRPSSAQLLASSTTTRAAPAPPSSSPATAARPLASSWSHRAPVASAPARRADLVAAGLTSDEAHGCAALLAQSEDQRDVEIRP